jgi:hypothetical protein
MVVNDDAILLDNLCRSQVHREQARSYKNMNTTPGNGGFRLWITYSTVTDFARLRGWSTSVPLSTAT